MIVEITGGIISGFVASDWLSRIIFPCVVGIIACVRLFFMMRKKPLGYFQRKQLQSAGMTKNEVEEVRETLQHVIKMPFQESGLVGYKLYVWQFIWSYLTALPFSLITGIIKVFLIDTN